MKTPNFIAWVLAAFLAGGFAGICRLQQGIDAQRSALQEEPDEVLLRSAKLVKGMSLEYAPLLADFYWTRVVQYYGIKRVKKETNLDSLWPLLDVTTTLDPNLIIAYRFGATFLSEAPPRGAGRPDLAVQLIERGIRANPDYWRFYEDLGFVYYIDMKDYHKASQAFLEGSKNPSAQIWMKIMAAKIASEGDSFNTSTFLWNEIYNSTPDPNVKRNAMDHLQFLRAAEDCKQLDEIGTQYEKRLGKRPARMSELIQAGLLRGMPADPLGYPYVIDENGKAQTSVDSPLHEQQVTLQSER
jgi:hypothetical protein